MKLRNLTPHPINFYRDEDIVTEGRAVTVVPGATPYLTLPSEGIARAQQSEVLLGEVAGISVFHAEYGEPEDLPEPQEGTGLIVSFLTASAAQAHGRTTEDLFLVAHTVRDAEGRIIGCTALSQL